jgi:4-hydroxybenzoate polyprenyltransferase
MSHTIELLRPQQWMKNIFIFAALVFSKNLFHPEFIFTSFIAFISFCLISSAVYIVNDIADVELDRLHPTKKNRPIASGKISTRKAYFIALSTIILCGLLLIRLNAWFIFIILLYFWMNLLYSFWLKRVALVDIFIIATGFMLRVLAGAVVIEVTISHWLVLCTLFVSIFLALSKRRGEIVIAGSYPNYIGREVLKGYPLELIDQFLTISGAGMAISYALYTVAERTVTTFHTENLIFTTVFVLFGIFRYMIIMKTKTSDDNPTSIILSDKVLLITVLFWFLTCVFIIYSKEIFSVMKI